MFKVTLLVVSLIAVSQAWVSHIPAPPREVFLTSYQDEDGTEHAIENNNDNHNELDKCVLKDYNNFEIKLGEEVKIPDKCIKAKCNGDASVDLTGCGKVLIPEGCTFKKPDLTLDYPACCEKDYECPEGTEEK